MLPEQPGPLWFPLELIGTAGNGVSGLALEVCKAPWDTEAAWIHRGLFWNHQLGVGPTSWL